jgi:hypothetical protein
MLRQGYGMVSKAPARQVGRRYRRTMAIESITATELASGALALQAHRARPIFSGARIASFVRLADVKSLKPLNRCIVEAEEGHSILLLQNPIRLLEQRCLCYT